MKILIISLTVLAVFVGYSFVALAHTDAENKIFILLTDDGFVPQEAKITLGGTIHFRNIGKNPHWPISETHQINQIYAQIDPLQKILPGDTWKFIPDKAGGWKIFDKLYPEFTGSIEVVKENPDAHINKTGFFSRLFSPLKELWLLVKNYTSNALALVNNNKASRLPDKNITKNSKAIFYNDNALYSYVSKFGPAESLALAEAIPNSYDRHNYAKKIGNITYELFQNQAFQWHDAALSSESMSGYFLGVISAYSLGKNISDITDELDKIISDISIRAHTLGHSLMMWSDYDLFASLETCEFISTKPKLVADCWGGVFMENITGGRSPETGHYTVFLNNDPQYPCNIVEEKYKDTCYQFMPYRFTQIFEGNFAEISGQCLNLAEKYRKACFAIMGRHAAQTSIDPAKAKLACLAAPNEEYQTFCVFGAARTLLWSIDEKNIALNFCRLITEPTEKNECYNAIFTRAKEVLSTEEEYNAFCRDTEPNFQATCFEFVPESQIFY